MLLEAAVILFVKGFFMLATAPQILGITMLGIMAIAVITLEVLHRLKGK